MRLRSVGSLADDDKCRSGNSRHHCSSPSSSRHHPVSRRYETNKQQIPPMISLRLVDGLADSLLHLLRGPDAVHSGKGAQHLSVVSRKKATRPRIEAHAAPPKRSIPAPGEARLLAWMLATLLL